MRPSADWVAPIVVCSCLVNFVLAEDNKGHVGNLGDFAGLVIRGVDTFDAEQIKRALVWDFEVVLAAHPSARLAAYPEVLRRRVLDGYLHAGFPDAHVDVELKAGESQLVLNVREGPRYLAGDIQVTGVGDEIADYVVRRMTQKGPPGGTSESAFDGRNGKVMTWIDQYGKEVEPDRPLWTAGEPAPFDSPTHARLHGRVNESLAELGFDQAEYKVSVLRSEKGNSANLVVDIATPGPAAVVREIEVVGNQKNTPHEMLIYLDVRPGVLFTQKEGERLRRAMWDSARFRGQQVKTERLPDKEGVKLHIQVVEYSKAPRLSEPLSPEEATLLKCRDWLVNGKGRDHDLVIDLIGQEHAMEIVVSPDHGFLAQLGEVPRDDSGVRFTCAFVFCEEEIACHARSDGKKLTLPAGDVQLLGHLKLALNEDEEQGKPYRVSAGATVAAVAEGDSKVPLRMALSFAPVCFLAMAHEDYVRHAWEDDVLTIWTTKGRKQIDSRDGRLIEYASAEDGDRRVSLRITCHEGVFQERMRRLRAETSPYAEMFDVQSPASSSGLFFCSTPLLDKLIGLKGAKNERSRQLVTPEMRRVAAKLINSGLLRPLDEVEATVQRAAKENEFHIPGTADAAGKAGMLQSYAWRAVGMADELFVRGGWPWTVWRETALVLSGHGNYTGNEIQKLFVSRECGPLCSLVLAELLVHVDRRTSQAFARRGLTCLDMEHFRNDYQVLLDDSSLVGKGVIRASEMLRELTDDEVFTLGVSLFGDPNLLGEYAHILRANSHESTSRAIAIALDYLWKSQLQSLLKSRLRELGEESVRAAGKAD